MIRSAVCLAGAVACLLLTLASPASADPTGIIYEVTLDADVIDLDTGVSDEEGHEGEIVFDGLPEIVPNDIVPLSPFLPGNDLVVTEHVVANPDGTETISIWVEGDGPPGTPLFVNTIDFKETVFVEFSGLHWNDPLMGGDIIDGEVFIAFGDLEFETIPLFVEVFGVGTEFSPLGGFLELDPLDFYLPAGDTDGTPATGLHVSLVVEHFTVPEPSTLLLAALALPGLLAYGRRRRRA